jgi:hypothetical protein
MTEKSLLLATLAKSPSERAAFLDEACAGQPDLRAGVEALLAAHPASGILDPPAGPAAQAIDADPGLAHPVATGEFTPHPPGAPPQATTTDYRPNSGAGALIAGRYTLVEKLGEGGMGEVWVAKQTEPVKRKVALKLIKAGMDSRAVLARFEQERQALALMDHPNIARVLDGGMTATGQPFFVMELIDGLALTKFCDEARLTPRERLELFIPVCQAVQHAHQKGIVHRDLKPANILVTRIDGRPVPKVIDFGVAKAIAGKLTDESLSTQFGAVVGTLEYMSPEQAGFAGEDIRHADRHLRARRHPVRAAHRIAAPGRQALERGGPHREDPHDPGRGALEAEHPAVRRRRAAPAGGLAADRAAPADGPAQGRAGLGGDEVPGEAARSPLRDRQRPGPRHPALPGR